LMSDSTDNYHALATQTIQQLGRRLGLDHAGCQRIEDNQCAVLELRRQRRAQRATLDLLRQLEVVAARLRPEHGAAVAPQRRPARSDPRAAGALLPPRLLPAAADERAILRGVRPA